MQCIYTSQSLFGSSYGGKVTCSLTGTCLFSLPSGITLEAGGSDGALVVKHRPVKMALTWAISLSSLSQYKDGL